MVNHIRLEHDLMVDITWLGNFLCHLGAFLVNLTIRIFNPIWIFVTHFLVTLSRLILLLYSLLFCRLLGIQDLFYAGVAIRKSLFV